MIATRKSKFAAAAVAATVLAGGSTAAFAAATTTAPAGGTGHVFVKGNVKSQVTQPILFTGAIGDYGTSTSKDKNGKVDPNGSYIEIVLKKGTFQVNAVALDKKLSEVVPVFTAATCSELFTGSGPTTVSDGTGLYKGISGTVTITETFAGIAARHANGTCNVSQSSQPVAQYVGITGVGKVKF
jgi:hypothetical protein